MMSDASGLQYFLTDHLGSASVVTDSTGAVVGEQRYYPFGETRLSTGTIFTDQLFTGQREMRRPECVEGTGLGIYHYNARFPAGAVPTPPCWDARLAVVS